MTTKITYAFFGFFIGLLIGSLAGIGELNYIKKSQRSSGLPILLIGGGIVGSVIGTSVGYKYGVSKHIKAVTGIATAKTTYIKQGRFWIASTICTDIRNKATSEIVTRKSNEKILITELDNRAIILHDTTSASKIAVEKHHNQAVKFIFSKLIESFAEKLPSDLETLFPTT